MKVNIYSRKGVKGNEVSLPKHFVSKLNVPLLAQAVRVYEDRSHTGLALVKTRAQVVRTKKKWYKQKGTGGARHGAKSAPIFVGGGVAHGPKGVSRVLKLPNKMKKTALICAISQLFSNEKAVLVNGLGKVAKTSDAAKIVLSLKKTLTLKKDSKVLVVLGSDNYKNNRFYKNIKNVEVVSLKALNAYKLLSSGFVLFESEIFNKKSKKP